MTRCRPRNAVLRRQSRGPNARRETYRGYAHCQSPGEFHPSARRGAVPAASRRRRWQLRHLWLPGAVPAELPRRIGDSRSGGRPSSLSGSSAAQCPDVERLAKLVGYTLSRSANFETGRNAYLSQASIVAKCGYTKTGPVSRFRGALRDDGWLYREGKGPAPKGGGRPNDRYRLTVPKHAHKHDGSALPHVES